MSQQQNDRNVSAKKTARNYPTQSGDCTFGGEQNSSKTANEETDGGRTPGRVQGHYGNHWKPLAVNRFNGKRRLWCSTTAIRTGQLHARLLEHGSRKRAVRTCTGLSKPTSRLPNQILDSRYYDTGSNSHDKDRRAKRIHFWSGKISAAVTHATQPKGQLLRLCCVQPCEWQVAYVFVVSFMRWYFVRSSAKSAGKNLQIMSLRSLAD